MSALRRPYEIVGLGYVKFLLCAEKGKSSKKGEQMNTNTRPKNKKPKWYHYGKLSYTTNIYRRQIGKSNPKPKFNGYWFTWKNKVIKNMSVDLRLIKHQILLYL